MNRRTTTQSAQQNTATTPAAGGLLQRACACGSHTMASGECEGCKKKQPLQHACLAPRGREAESKGEIPPIVYEVLRSPGEPLDPATRAYFEPRFEHDFTQVRVHTDAKGAESARSVNALAYTVGRDVVFGESQYAPYTGAGQMLLGHELTHVVEQSTTGVSVLARQTRTEVARDEYLRGLARRPSEALGQWRRLRPGEQTVVVTYMSAYYGLTFAQRFMDTVRRRPRPEMVIHITNLPEVTPERLRRSGYRLLGTFERIEYWVHPSGNEVWVLRSAPRAPQPPQPPPQPEPPENPPRIRIPADPERVYGRSVAERADANIAGLNGYAVRYADGTLEFYREGTTGPWTYRPRPGGGYDFYDENGEKTEGLVMIIDPDEVFGAARGASP